MPRVGFEPTALGLEVLCSIQLSYQGELMFQEGPVPPFQSRSKFEISFLPLKPALRTGASRGRLFSLYHLSVTISYVAGVVQRLVCKFSKLETGVRFSPPAPVFIKYIRLLLY